jgi:hypothetical protein
MGGYGSGGRNKKHHYTENTFPKLYAKQFLDKSNLGCTEEVKHIIFKWCEKDGSFEFSFSEIKVCYFIGNPPPDIHGYKLELLPKPLGNYQPFLQCPICNNRRNYLFLVAKAVYVCRKCISIRYASQREGYEGHQINRQRRVVRSLKGKDRDLPEKPKWMHHRTYDKALNEYYDAEKSIEEFFEKGFVKYEKILTRININKN